MIYVKFYGGNGYCGCDYEEYHSFPDDTTEEQLIEFSDELCYENASMYDTCIEDLEEEEFDSYEKYEEALYEATEEYYTDAIGDHEIISKEEYAEATEKDIGTIE